MKQLTRTALTAVLALSLASCSKPSSASSSAAESAYVPEGPVTVTVWNGIYDSGLKKILGQAADAFNSTNGMKITVVLEDVTDYSGLSAAVHAEGDGPDLFFATPAQAAEYVSSDPALTILGDVEAYADDMKEILDRQAYNDAKGFRDGIMHMVPMTTSGSVLYYNRTMFAEAGYENGPATWDDLMDAASKIHDAYGISGFEITDRDASLLMETLLIQDGAAFVNTETLTSDIGSHSEALRFVLDGIRQGQIAQTAETGFTSGDLNEKKTASFLGSIADRVWLELGDDLGIAVMPQTENGTDFTPSYQTGAVLLKSTPDEEWAAVQFARYLLSAEVSAPFCVAAKAVSPVTKIRMEPTYFDVNDRDPAILKWTNDLARAKALPACGGLDTIAYQLNHMLEEAVNGKDLQEAAAFTEANINYILTEYNR